MRRDQRYPVALACSIETNTGSPQAGLIVDVSRGGAGIETMANVTDDFTLVFTHGGLVLRLPSTPRHSRDLWGKRKLHAQFRSLTAEQQAEVDRLVESVATAGQDQDPPSRSLMRSLRHVLRR